MTAETKMTDEQRQRWRETGLFPLELWRDGTGSTPLECPMPDRHLLRSLAKSIPAHIQASGWYAKNQSGGFQSVYADNFTGMGRQAIACAPYGKSYFGLLAEYIAAACPRTMLRLLDRIEELESRIREPEGDTGKSAEADARDAARYRWLKKHAGNRVDLQIDADCLETSESLDASIDAVISAGRAAPEGRKP